MASDIVAFPSKDMVKCCDCACSSLTTGCSLDGVWIRSVKRKYDEFERSSQFYVPGLDTLPVARVGIENECALLRETVSKQQETIQELFLELEEERNASSSAANEAMSMILRLQREKAEVEMEARQFKRFAEEKMSHDAQEIAALEEVLYKREQGIQSLTCEVQAYKHRMMSFGITESEAEGLKDGYSRSTSFSSDNQGQFESPACPYPPLRCNLNDSRGPSDFEDDTVEFEKYPFGEAPMTKNFKDLDYRIHRLERNSRDDHGNGDFGSKSILEKFIVGSIQSPRRPRHSKMFSVDSASSLGPDYAMGSPKWGASFKKLDCVAEELKRSYSVSDYDDDLSDRVYTIDPVHPGVPCYNATETKVASKICDEYVSSPKGSNDIGSKDSEVMKLYLRLQALEADRETMRQTIMSIQTDKAQLVLLREIAQQLCKDMTPAKPKPCEKTSITKRFSVPTVFKWILSFIFWRKKALKSKYLFDLASNNAGLLLLLDKSPRTKLWRCVSSTQVGKQSL